MKIQKQNQGNSGNGTTTQNGTIKTYCWLIYLSMHFLFYVYLHLTRSQIPQTNTTNKMNNNMCFKKFIILFQQGQTRSILCQGKLGRTFIKI